MVSAYICILPFHALAYINQFNTSTSIVVGQTNFTSNSVNQGGSAAANTLNMPLGVYTYGGKFFVILQYHIQERASG
jgi:hypothetical protein